LALTYEQACALYERGPEVTVKELMRFSQEIDELNARIQVLQALLKNKGTEPSTPSGSIPPHQKPNAEKGKGKKGRKKPGRKKGHKGSGRRSPKNVQGEMHYHLTQCPCCGGKELRETTTFKQRFIEGLKRLQTWAVRHIAHNYYCPTCKKMVSAKIIEALPKGQINLYTFVLGAWLHYSVGMSLSNVVRQFRLAGLKITEAGLIDGWRRMSEYLTPYYEQIIEEIKRSALLSADETGWRISGVTYWLWYFGTKEWSYYVVDKRRSSDVVKKVVGHIFKGILICDFWGAYNMLEAAAKQRCIFHLLTELLKVDKRNHSDTWRAFRKKLYRLIRDAIKLGTSYKDLDETQYKRRQARIQERLQAIIDADASDKDAKRLQKRLRRHQNELFVFLDHPETVSPYNNHAEQEMRKPVLTRRISHGNRSEQGAMVHAIFMSLFRSLELQGLEPVDGVLKLIGASMCGSPLNVKTLFSKIRCGEAISIEGQTATFHPVEEQQSTSENFANDPSPKATSEETIKDEPSSCQPEENVRRQPVSKTEDLSKSKPLSQIKRKLSSKGRLKASSRGKARRKTVKPHSKNKIKFAATVGIFLLWLTCCFYHFGKSVYHFIPDVPVSIETRSTFEAGTIRIPSRLPSFKDTDSKSLSGRRILAYHSGPGPPLFSDQIEDFSLEKNASPG
jgi:transposase